MLKVPLKVYMRKRNAKAPCGLVAPQAVEHGGFGERGEGSLHLSRMLLTLASYMVGYKWYPTLQPLTLREHKSWMILISVAWPVVLQPSITGGERPMTRHSYGWRGVRRTSQTQHN